MKSMTALATAAATAFSVLQTVSGATTWRLLRSDSDASGVTNAYSWVSTSSNSIHSGEPGEDLSPNEIYLVRGGYVLNTISGNVLDTVFKGKQLTLGQGTTSTGRVRQRTYGAARTTWDNWGANTGLILAYGLYEAYAGSGTTSEISASRSILPLSTYRSRVRANMGFDTEPAWNSMSGFTGKSSPYLPLPEQ